ncbi:MAG: hypothetical protein GOMPHAMPRED_002377 [Gomphillus americanus]|uniref:Uncharacterized protein n=1 Tax=Gomphillus americanus TaxID=1940652 RepID=A0A8H3FBR0_9LECA|nr:MAG: hypothetical protein GOMPHAMPRED_002377 [Gomphillus americanus]
MRFQIAVLLPLAAATFFPQEPQHHARSLDQYDDEIFEILARDLAANEDFYLESREASHGGMSRGGHGGHGHHKGHKKHKKGRKGHHGKKHHHSHGGGHHAAGGMSGGMSGGAAGMPAGGSADPSGAEESQSAPARRSIADIEDMLYIRELLDAYGGFDAEGLDM